MEHRSIPNPPTGYQWKTEGDAARRMTDGIELHRQALTAQAEDIVEFTVKAPRIVWVRLNNGEVSTDTYDSPTAAISAARNILGDIALMKIPPFPMKVEAADVFLWWQRRRVKYYNGDVRTWGIQDIPTIQLPGMER